MTDAQYNFWDIIIKGVITPVLAIVTVLFGLWQYIDGQRKMLEREYQLKKNEREEKLFEEKTALYKETRQILSYLSTHDAKDEFYASKEHRFWELYWGDLAAVESREIESLMVSFGKLLNDAKNASAGGTSASMKQLSLSFAHRTREELGEQE